MKPLKDKKLIEILEILKKDEGKIFAPIKRTSPQGLGGFITFPRKCGDCGKVLNSMPELNAHFNEHISKDMPRIMDFIDESRARYRRSHRR